MIAGTDHLPKEHRMRTLVIFEFPSEGPWGDDMTAAYSALAEDIAGEPGLLWKIWTEAPDRKVAGGVYLFEDEASAQAYTAKHSERLKQFGITGIDVRQYSDNEALSKITRG